MAILQMERIQNFRDFGGLPTADGGRVREGLFFRSGHLADASEEDLNRLRSLGVRTVCDLRSVHERTTEPDRLPEDSGIRYVTLPIRVHLQGRRKILEQFLAYFLGGSKGRDFGAKAREMYREFVAAFTREFSEVVQLAIHPENLPVLIHCTAGKDRTGFACSLIQGLLGVPEPEIREEYLLSNHVERELTEYQRRWLANLEKIGIPRSVFLPLFEAREEYLDAAYDQACAEFGGLDAFLRFGLRIDESDQQRAIEALTSRP